MTGCAWAAEPIEPFDDAASVSARIAQLHETIAAQVSQKKLPEKRLVAAERLKRAFAKRQIELDAQLQILKIDLLAESDGRAESVEKIIETAREQERITLEYLIRLQRLGNLEATFDPAADTASPPFESRPSETKDRRDEAVTFQWVPEDLSSGTHD